MDPKDLARWAAKFAKKGTRAAVEMEEDRPAPPRAGVPQSWGPPRAGHQPARAGQVWGPPPETDVLVKPAPSAYADILSRVPDLAPDMTGGADSMSGRPSEDSLTALREAGIPSEGVRPEDPRDAVPRGHRGLGGGYSVPPLADSQKPN